VNNFINYENDNFFEAEDDRLIVIKKIQDHYHFWERIDQAFFRTNISKDLLAQLESLYMIKSDKLSVVISEVQHQLGKLGDGVDRLRLSNQCR
jgi:hypothetical protein